MRGIKYLFLIFLGLLLSGCSSVAISPSGEQAPVLAQPIPKTNKILLISSLGQKVSFVDETGIRYYKTHFETTSTRLNQAMSRALKQQLQTQGYNVSVKSLPATNPLTTAHVQKPLGNWSNRIAHGALMTGPLRGRLTDAAKGYLDSLNKGVNAETIILIIRDPEAATTYAIACNKKHSANIAVFFRLYILEADGEVLSWMPGTARGELPNSAACQNARQATTQQINQLTQLMVKPTVDLAKQVLDRALNITVQSMR